MEFIKNKTKNMFFLYLLIFIPMWVIFLIEDNLKISLSNLLAIHPRTMEWKESIGIMGSWMAHANTNHILGNSIGLVGLIFVVGLFEQKILKLFFLLILTSGLSTWLLGESNSAHVGASGLIFALFGYILGSAFTGRRWIYFIPILIVVGFLGFAYFEPFINGLIVKEDVSFAAHFGGLLSGILVGLSFDKERSVNTIKLHKKTIKQKWNDFVWDFQYKMKKLKK